jgi:hypothetical protein
LRAHRILLLAAGLLPAIFAGIMPAYEKHLPQPDISPPFSIGERLIYTIKWDPPWYLFFLPAMQAGEIDLQLIGEAEYENKTALKISFQANSSGTLAKMAGLNVNDDFTFYTNPKTFCTFAAFKEIREGKRKRQIYVDYLRETRQLHFREIDESVDPPKVKKDEIKDDIPSCVHDPLSALYLLRMSELGADYVRTFAIGHDDKIKEITARVEAQESIETPAGKFTAWKISASALMGGLFKDGGQFRIWISADDRKIPVQFEVKVRLGKVLGKLKTAANGNALLSD